MIEFYTPDIARTLQLSEEESAHCCRVLRHREGDTITVTDGRGMQYDCVITEAHPKHTHVEITDRREVARHWNFSVTLAVAPTKNMDRMEWLVEKAVEIGVDRIVLLGCDRSERRVVKPERLRKITVSAMKQSLKCRLPEVEGPVDFRKFVADMPSGCRVMGYCDDSLPRLGFVNFLKPGEDVVIMIGPEGDFSPAEVQLALENGVRAVTFGNNRLRTETAALYGLQAAHIINEMNNEA